MISPETLFREGGTCSESRPVRNQPSKDLSEKKRASQQGNIKSTGVTVEASLA